MTIFPTQFHTYTIPICGDGGPVMAYDARKRFERLYMNEEIINPFWEACADPCCALCGHLLMKSHRQYMAADFSVVSGSDWYLDRSV